MQFLRWPIRERDGVVVAADIESEDLAQGLNNKSFEVVLARSPLIRRLPSATMSTVSSESGRGPERYRRPVGRVVDVLVERSGPIPGPSVPAAVLASTTNELCGRILKPTLAT